MSAFVDGVGIASGAVVVLTGVAAIMGGVRARWRSTVGSRRSLKLMFNRVNVGLPAENLEAMFGPCTIRRPLNLSATPQVGADVHSMPPLQQQIYITKHACIDVYVEPAMMTVVAFCITVTDPRFGFDAGKLSFGFLGKVHVGRTKFAASAVPQGGSDGVSYWSGARDAGYAEAHYAGNPGGYQTYVLAWLGTGVGQLAYDEVPQNLGGWLTTGRYAPMRLSGLPEADNLQTPSSDVELGGYDPSDWKWFRAKTTINTFQVLGPEWSNELPRPGVHGDITRLLVEPPRSLINRARAWRANITARRAVRRARFLSL